MDLPEDDFVIGLKKLSRQLDWNLLKTFHDIVQANGITAAANVSWSKQSTLSLSLKRLEGIVGCRLCQRGRAGFYLTEEGKILYKHTRKIYESLDEMQAALEQSQECISGVLSIAIISNFSSQPLDDIYVNYHQRHPGVTMNIDVMSWEGILKHIINNDYDVGISPISNRHSDLRYDYLTTEYHNIYCGRQHFLFGKSHCENTLSDEPFILTGPDEPDSLTSFRLRHRLGHKITARTPSLEEAKRLTLAGVGICILPEQLAASDVANGTLWPLMERCEEMSCGIYMITNIRAPKRLARDAFISKALEVINCKA